MHFTFKYEVTVTNLTRPGVAAVIKQIKTVMDIKLKNDTQHLGSTCELTVPLMTKVQYQDKNYLTASSLILFQSGDSISVRAKYEGMDWLDLFAGFVVDVTEGTPCVVRCSDYIYKLNQGTLNIHHASVSLKNLLDEVLEGTGVKQMQGTFDFKLVNITFSQMSPAAILEWLKKELGINISLQGAELYCNIASNTLSRVKFQTDRNVIKADLQKNTSVFQRIKVKAWFANEDGTKSSVETGDLRGTLKEVYFYKVRRDDKLYRQLAAEALRKFRMAKYNGSIVTYLYPFCDLFWAADYQDMKYPDRSGSYSITSIDTDIGMGGVRRTIKLAYLGETNE